MQHSFHTRTYEMMCINEKYVKFLELVDADYYFNFPEIAYSSASSDEINDNFFPYDGHWNQKGSDKFADFFVDYVSEKMTSEKQ